MFGSFTVSRNDFHLHGPKTMGAPMAAPAPSSVWEKTAEREYSGVLEQRQPGVSKFRNKVLK